MWTLEGADASSWGTAFAGVNRRVRGHETYEPEFRGLEV
jgi:hypothetical protein